MRRPYGFDVKVVGTCSLCGGPVVVPRIWWGVGPFPPPRCQNCGAVAKEDHGPVIPMEPRREYTERSPKYDRTWKAKERQGMTWRTHRETGCLCNILVGRHPECGVHQGGQG